MEDQLVTGQWVEIVVGEPTDAARLCGFVLSLRPNEMLLTFPDLLSPPEGLEVGQLVTVQHTNSNVRHSGKVHILRLAMGPPFSVALERLAHMDTEMQRRASRISVSLPVTARVRRSEISGNQGQVEKRARTRNVSSTGMLIETSLRVTIGDILDLTISGLGLGQTPFLDPYQLSGRVVRMEALNATSKRAYGVAVELVPETEEVRQRWVQFALELQHSSVDLTDNH